MAPLVKMTSGATQKLRFIFQFLRDNKSFLMPIFCFSKYLQESHHNPMGFNFNRIFFDNDNFPQVSGRFCEAV